MGAVGRFGRPRHFRLGRPWLDVARSLQLRGITFTAPFTVPSRRTHLFELASGQFLVTVWHSGSAGPPAGADAVVLQRAVEPFLG